MPKIARGRGTGASSVTSASAIGRAVGGVRSPVARRSRTVPVANATTSSPRTSPAVGLGRAGARNVASRIGSAEPRRIDQLEASRCQRRQWSFVDASAIKAAAAATAATYRSFADATRSVLDLLERHMPDAVLYLAHLDRGQFIHRIVDTRNGGGIGLRSNLAIPLGDAFCSHMAEDRAPRHLQRRRAPPGLRARCRCSSASARAPTSACRSSSRTARASARWPRCVTRCEPFDRRRRAALHRCSRACSPPSSSARATSATCAASTTCCATRPRDGRDRPRGHARSPAPTTPATAVCEAACEVAGAPVAFLLEPAGRDFVSTAMAGVEHRAGDDPAARRRRTRARPRVHVQGHLLRRRRAQPPGARRRRWSRPPAPARPCSSRCCATARSRAC